jgi:hypothetical protein
MGIYEFPLEYFADYRSNPFFPYPARNAFPVKLKRAMNRNVLISTIYVACSLMSINNEIQSTHYYRFYDFKSRVVVLEGYLTTKTEIDVSKLRKGEYILKIEIDKDKEEAHHVIIN